MPTFRTLNQAFFKTWSPDMAYVLGYFAADGCMIANARNGHYIEFTSTDHVLLRLVQRVTCAHQTIRTRKGDTRNHGKWKQTYRLQIGSNAWFGDLVKLGFSTNKSKTLIFPDVPETYLGDFVRGYFDGDGCVYFTDLKYTGRSHKRWILMTLFTSGSREFLETLMLRLRPYNVKGGSFHQKERGYDLRFSHRDSLALYVLMYNTAPISELYLPRKREKLERAIQVLGLDKVLRS